MDVEYGRWPSVLASRKSCRIDWYHPAWPRGVNHHLRMADEYAQFLHIPAIAKISMCMFQQCIPCSLSATRQIQIAHRSQDPLILNEHDHPQANSIALTDQRCAMQPQRSCRLLAKCLRGSSITPARSLSICFGGGNSRSIRTT